MEFDRPSINSLEPHAVSRIIEMAWEDRTPFEAIETQFGLSEKDVISIMRSELNPSGFRMWRKRVSGRKTKHQELRSDQVNRFRSRGNL